MAGEKKAKKTEADGPKGQTNGGKGEKKVTEPHSARAYSRYARNPVFIGLVALSVLLVLLVLYFTMSHSPTVAAPPAPADNTSGKLVIYEFSDFKCPYCSAAAGFNKDLIKRFRSQDPTWEPADPGIMEQYGDRVDLEFKHFIVHESARKAAEAAECARDQGKFWEMHDVMFENQAKLEVDDLKGYAADIGLNSTEFDACLDSGEKASVVSDDTALGKKLGVSGTPTFFIGGENGWEVVGAQPFSKINATIAKALNEEFPESPPGKGQSIGSFDSLVLDSGICTEGGKPVIRMFSTTGCPHCRWVGPAFDEVAREYMDEGKVVAYHWDVDSGDNTLTDEVETKVPESEMQIYSQFNSRGSVPTFVFGCRYYRVGTRYEAKDDLDSEKSDFRKVIDALLQETG